MPNVLNVVQITMYKIIRVSYELSLMIIKLNIVKN